MKTDNDHKQSILQQVIALIISPLVRLLIKHNVSHSEFSEMARQAYVDQAYRHFSIPKKKMTYARAAVLTGLSRKEIVRLRTLSETETASKQPKMTVNRAARVITGWLQDKDFLNQQQQPKALNVKASTANDNSFAELVERYSGDISAGAILDELLLSKQVSKTPEGKVELQQAGYISDGNSLEQMQILAQCAHNLLATGSYNIQRSDEQPPRFQRQLSYRVSPAVAVEFQHYSQSKSLELLLDFNHWLGQKNLSQSNDNDKTDINLGVGIYYFENLNPANKN